MEVITFYQSEREQELIVNNIKTSMPQSIGERIAILRHLLGYTQTDFASEILMARCSLVNLEKSRDDDAIGVDILLRLFYTMTRFYSETKPQIPYAQTLAKEIIDAIISVMDKKTADMS